MAPGLPFVTLLQALTFCYVLPRPQLRRWQRGQ